MPKANVFNMDGEKVGEIELSAAIFGIEPNQMAIGRLPSGDQQFAIALLH